MKYILPDNRIVEVHDDVARDAPFITFQLADGRIVIAIRAIPH
jgi:hypothetical protein